jgi:hypothetical protein
MKKKKKPRRDKNTMSSFSSTFTDFEAEWFFRKLFLTETISEYPESCSRLFKLRRMLFFLRSLCSFLFFFFFLFSPFLPPSLLHILQSRKNLSSIREAFLIYPETLSILEASRPAGFFFKNNLASIHEEFLIHPETLSILEVTRPAGFFFKDFCERAIFQIINIAKIWLYSRYENRKSFYELNYWVFLVGSMF